MACESPEVLVHAAKLVLIDASVEFRRLAGLLSDRVAREMLLEFADRMDEGSAELLVQDVPTRLPEDR